MNNAQYQKALKNVRARVKASRSSFTAGMIVLPKARREAMFGLYAFCREVDDIADDGATLALRRKGLQEWRERIHALFADNLTDDGITEVLFPAIRLFGLIERDFQAIIDGMAMDAEEPICAPKMNILDTYCDHVASAVGRVSVRIFGEPSTKGERVAYHLGRAFQLTNILRDLAEDAERKRLYLPEELLDKHRIASRDPDKVLRHPHLKFVCRDLAAVAGKHFAEADAAMRLCARAAMRPPHIMRAYYGEIYKRLLENDWRDPFKRVTLPRWKKAGLMLRGAIGKVS